MAISIFSYKRIMDYYKLYIENNIDVKFSPEMISYYNELLKTVVKPAIISTLNGGIFDVSLYSDFYDSLFKKVCSGLINSYLSTTYAGNITPTEIMNYMEEQRQDDRMFYMLEYGDKPDNSGYEFNIPRMLEDIDKYVNRRLEEFEGPRKK